MTVSATFKNRLFSCYSTQIVRFSSKISATGTSSQTIVIERDRKQCADVNCEKHDFSYIIPNVFDRLSRHLGFSKIGAPYCWSQQSRSPISMVLWHKLSFVTITPTNSHRSKDKMEPVSVQAGPHTTAATIMLALETWCKTLKCSFN